MTQLQFRTVAVDGIDIFYREAGDVSKPTLLLLHGFPTASHMFRDLIPLIHDDFHVVAPDFPGFGRSGMPDRRQFTYSFDNIAHVMERFTEVIGLDRYALYIFDYGAPIGLRLAMRHPERVTAIVTQNGNSYEEGLSAEWDPMQQYWREPTDEFREQLRGFLSPDAIRMQYEQGAPDTARISPDGSTLDAWYMQRPGAQDVQLDLMRNYETNVALYPAIQAYFRKYLPPLLAIWGRNDPFFLPAGAEAYRRDLPKADVQLLDTGHFALETHAYQIATAIKTFLKLN